MKQKQRVAGSVIAFTVLIGAGGCSEMSRRDQNTLAGAGIGGVAGAVLTDGSALGTLGGAAVGGVIGHELTTDRDRREYRHRNDNRYRHGSRYGNDRYRRGDRDYWHGD